MFDFGVIESYQHFIHKVIHNSYNINNYHIKLSTLYSNLSTLQNIVNTTLLHSYPHYNIKLSTPLHIVFNTTSFFSALLCRYKVNFQLQIHTIQYSFHISKTKILFIDQCLICLWQHPQLITYHSCSISIINYTFFQFLF